MSITTTCIGAYPKPDYIEIGNFAETGAAVADLPTIDAQRLLAAPDCGLMMLGRELAMAKLKNTCAAAEI